MNEERRKRPRIDWWLIATFVIASVVGGVLVSRVREWGIMTDELLYTDMARSIAGSGLPLPRVRGDSIAVNQVLFPLVIAPIVGIFSMPTAYPIIAVFNAVLFASAAFPTYLLANYLTENRTAARFVAACTVAVPWVVFADKVMTDAIAYPAFLWAFYAIVRSAARPGIRGELLALLAIFLAYLARSQFVVLFAAWPAAVALRDVAAAFAAERSARSIAMSLVRLPLRRPFAVGAFVVVALLVLFKPVWIVGVYTSTTTSVKGGVVPGGLAKALATHLGMIAIGIGAIPLVLGLPWLVAALARVESVRQNSVAVATVVIGGILLYVGASFDQRFSQSERVFERYVFYLAPLMLCAAAALFVYPPKRWYAFALPAIAGMFVFAAEDHYGLDSGLTISNNQAFAPVQIFQIALQKVADVLIISVTQLLVILSLVAVAGAYWAIQRGRAQAALKVSFAFVLAYGIVATVYTVPKAVDAQNASVAQSLGKRSAAQKAWVESALGGGEAAIVESSFNIPQGKLAYVASQDNDKWRDVELWNGGITSFYARHPEYPGGRNNTFSPDFLTVDWASGRIALRRDETADHLLMSAADSRFAPVAVLNDDVTRQDGFALYKFAPPPRAAWATRGLTAHGWVPKDGATLRVFGWSGTQTGGSVAISLEVARRYGQARVSIDGANVIQSLPTRHGAAYSWTADPPAGGYVDFRIERAGGGDMKTGHAQVRRIVLLATGR